MATWCQNMHFQAVTHPSTNRARRRLTSAQSRLSSLGGYKQLYFGGPMEAEGAIKIYMGVGEGSQQLKYIRRACCQRLWLGGQLGDVPSPGTSDLSIWTSYILARKANFLASAVSASRFFAVLERISQFEDNNPHMDFLLRQSGAPLDVGATSTCLFCLLAKLALKWSAT